MDFIKPTDITDSLFWGANVPENDYDEWVGGSSYAVGDKRIVSTPNVHKVFECLVGQTSGITPDLLDEDGESISDWTEDSAGMGGVIIDPAGQIKFQAGSTGSGDYARIKRTIDSPPNLFTMEIKTYFDALYESPGYPPLRLRYGDGSWQFLAYFKSTGLTIYKAGSLTTEVGSGIVKYNTTAAWQTWRFQVDKTTPASATVEVFLKEDGGVFASQGTFDCDYEPGSGTDGEISLELSSVASYAQRCHVKYLKIATGNSAFETVNDSPVDNSDWLDLGATNRWAMFDGTIGNQTSQATPIIMVLAPGAIDSVALLNIESTSVEIVEIDNDDNLVTNGTAWTGATGTTQPTSWDKVGTPADYTIDGGMIKITTDSANEGQSQTITVSAATEYQLLGKYKNTSGDIAQIAIDRNGIISGSVTMVNTKISAVDGTAFVDFSTANILTDHVLHKCKLTIIDSVGKKIVGYIKAAGTSETLDSNLWAAFDFTNASKWTPTNATVVDANSFTATSANGLMSPASGNRPTALGLYKISYTAASSIGATFIYNAFPSIASGSAGVYRTPESGYANILGQTNGTTVDVSVLSMQRVLAPSATGVTITSTEDGSTYNWTSKEAGFNYNDASGYSYEIEGIIDILSTTDLVSSTVESIFSQVFTTPAGCTSIKISLMGKSTGDIVWFDTVTLAPTEYSETVTTGTSKTDVVKLDVPQKTNGILTVTINYTAGTAKLGELIVGVKTNIGTMRYSPSIGITDYSTKAVDVYGHYSIVPRTFAKRMTCSLIILNTVIDEVVRLLTLYRSTELVWVGDANYNSLIVYGYYKDFQVVFARPNSSDCALEIEGLT